MGVKFFYGRCKVRPVVKVDMTDGTTQVIFSTQRRPSGTKVEDPEEGTSGNNSAEHLPPKHVTLYLVPGGTGEADEADPITTWGLIDTANALENGTLRAICNGYLTKEWSVRKTDSEGGESVERRFAVEIIVHKHKAINDQGLGVLAQHSAAIILAILESQAEFDDMPAPNKKPKRKAKDDSQAGLFTAELDPPHETTMAVMTLGPKGLTVEFPDQEPQDPDGVQPTWDFTTFSTAKLLRVLEGGAATPDYLQAVRQELNLRPVELHHAEQDLLDAAAALPADDGDSMLDKASKARRGKGPFKLLPAHTQEDGVSLAVWIERSIRSSLYDRVTVVALLKELSAEWAGNQHTKESLLAVVATRPDLLGVNPNGTVFSAVSLADPANA